MNKIAIEGTFLNFIKNTYQKGHNYQKYDTFTPRLGRTQGHSLTPFLFNNVLEVLLVQYDKKRKMKVYILGSKKKYFVDYSIYIENRKN